MPACTTAYNNTATWCWIELGKAGGKMSTSPLRERKTFMDGSKAQLKFSPTNSSSNFIAISPSTCDHPSVSKIAIFASSSSRSYLTGQAELNRKLCSPGCFLPAAVDLQICSGTPARARRVWADAFLTGVTLAFIRQIRPVLVLLKLHPPSAR